MKPRSLTRLLLLLSADLAAIALARPDVGRVGRELSAPHAAVSREGADVVAVHLAGCAVWLVLCWLAIGVTAALLACLPGAFGAAGRRASCVVLPVAMRRLVAGAAGLGVFVAPVGALAGTAGHSTGVAAAGTANAPAAAARSAPVPLPSPLLPSSAPASGAQLPAPVIPAGRAAPAPAQPGDCVVVRPGDSLWRITERSLGEAATPGATAAAWPSWYGANRAVIGDDPALLQPGEVLQPPSGAATTS